MVKIILDERALRHSAFLNRETVVMTPEEYEELVFDSKKLAALEVCGVNDWEYYQKAMELISPPKK